MVSAVEPNSGDDCVLAHLILIVIAGALWCYQWWFLLRSPRGRGSLAEAAWAAKKKHEAGVMLSALRIYSYLRNNLSSKTKPLGKIFARTRKFCPG
jgi:hypothetical protein